MEVVCSLDDVAQVLADDGYNLVDDPCCFDDATDFPSVLNAFNVHHQFPESPCSDEDIARVLDIPHLHNSSLMTSCTAITPPVTSFSPHESFTKTRDPCISDAVLRHPMINELPDFTIRPPQNLELFTINLNCPFSDDSPHFNAISKTKEHESFNNYFNSSSALSPLSETDSILTPESLVNNCSQNIPQNVFESLNEKDITERFNVNFDLLPNSDFCSHSLSNIDTCPASKSDDTPTNAKRKRRRKTPKVTKTKKRKQDTPSAKPSKSKSKVKKNECENVLSLRANEEQPLSADLNNNINLDSNNSCHQAKNTKPPIKNKRTPRKTKKSDVEASKTQNTETTEFTGTECSRITSTTTRPSSSEIGSTNGVINDETKGLRRSSRATKSVENYNFRLSSLVKRVETERKQTEPKQPKGKEKPPPLSKYRRRTANARERDRMKEINDAFEVLKNTLPDMERGEKQKITKFTILKLALNYIASLQDLLGHQPTNTNSVSNDYTDSQHVISLPSDSVDDTCVSVSTGENMSCNALVNTLHVNNSALEYTPITTTVNNPPRTL